MGTNPTKLAVLLGSLLSASISSVALAANHTPNTSPSIDSQISPNTMESIVVIGRNEHTPLDLAANVKVIDAATIEVSAASSLTEVLRSQAGIQVSDSNSGAVFSMRGFTSGQAANNTLILLDGRRLNHIDIAAPNIDAIPLNQIERVEILSGSAGVLYGDQAVGGVINIVTKSPDATQGSIELGLGSFDAYESKFDVAGRFAEDWRYFFAASYGESDNYREHNANQTGSILGRIQYELDEQNFYLEASYYDDDQELAGALSESDFDIDPRQSFNTNQYLHNISKAVRSGYQQQVSETWNLSLDAGYSDTLVNGFVWGPSTNERSLLEFSPKAIAAFDTANGPLTVVSGVDYKLGESDFKNGRRNEQTSYSAYVQATVPVTDSLSYIVGGRYAKAEDELVDPVYPNGVELEQDADAFEFGLNYRPSAAHRLYVRADDNFRFAKVDEQAYTSPGVVGLKPQTGRSFEAGWDYTTQQHVLRINVYRLDLENEIVWDPNAQKPDLGFFNGANVNADESRRYGASVDWDWQLSTALQLGGEYHYIDAEFTEGTHQGKQLSWVAEHNGSVFISHDLSDHWQLFADAVYVGERFMEGDNANVGDQLDSYVLTNVAINYRRDAWLASLKAENLFDETYVSGGYYSSWGSGFYTGTGRNVRFSVSYRF
ncbi:TonB-dependent receptor [Shewanella gelidii]|uniref:TonB-dependent receptor n=1 Tax=Shewanella gelidii TaxID=1642821 RepID=A0A917N6Y3_9GAMM|nr:TonB-dependent receptor [Shewanella gelidii]MCL1096911.1 TonB-dependent receptor [Shewanella gelidii]GGI71136.1 TonB-dependent receptor [Shewanella gelidii]